MNRKIRILVLFLMLALFTGSQVYAQDRDDSLPDSKEKGILAESSFPEKPLTAEARKEVKNSEGGQGKEAENLPPDQAEEAKEEESVAQPGGETGKKDLQKENPDPKSPAQKPKDQEPQDLESSKQANPAQTGETGDQNATQSPGNTEEGKETTGKKPEDKKDNKEKPQVDPKGNEDLEKLQEQINTEKDPKEKAKLQKEYNDKLLKSIEESGADKLNKDVINGITNPEKIKQYKDIQELYDKIQADKNDGKLNQEDIDKLNALLGEFKPPRKLTAEEKKAREILDKGFDKGFEIPGVKEDKGNLFKDYQDAKEALEKALDPNEDPVTPKKLKELQDAYKKAKEALKQAIDAGTIEPKYTADDKPEVRVYPLDGNTAGKKLDDDTYYIPDKTNLNLLIEVRKDGNKEFKFTIKPNKTDENIIDADLLDQMVRFKNGDPVKLTYDEKTGTYSFTTSDEFQIAQLKLNLPAFRAAFHEGFEIEMKAGDQGPVTKKFLITKKGYDDADIGTIGTEKPKDPQEIDGGDTKDGIVDEDTKKVYDIFAMIKETDGYIDDVIVNSGNGESLPLSSVDITIKLPEYNGKFADYIHKSGLEYQYNNKDRTYTLKLQMKNFGGNLTKDKDGNLLYKGKPFDKADLTDKILEESGKKVYVDEKGNTHEITTEEYYEGGDYKVEKGVLYKKNGETYEEIGEFKDGKLKKGDTTYVFSNGKLISYTDEKALFEGNVSNKKDGEADLDVTPTYKGDQVIITTGDNKQAYGGTIIENGIFKDGKYTGKTSSDEGYQVLKNVYVDKSGKKVDNPTEEEKETLTPVDEGVFNAAGYLISGLTYNKDYTLIDKFGKIMDGITVTKIGDNYTFKKGTEEKTSGSDGITVGKGTKFVGNDNYIVDPKGYDDPIVGKYYYDGKRFVPVKDDDKGIKGNKYFTDYTSSDMDYKKVDTYKKDANTTVELHNVEEYHGSTNPEDYVSVDGKTYVKKQAGSLVYYVGVGKDNQADVLSVEQISKIVQIFNDGTEKITDETDIAEAVKNAKFQIKFPGFLAGKDIVYNIHADIAATYLAPNKDFDPDKDESDENPRFIKTSIFKDQDAEYKKPIDKYFTLKLKEGQPASFFKNPPKELLAKPDYNFFNIFYRDETDRDRDDYIKHLLEIEDNKDAKVNPENKEKMDILSKIQGELARLYNGAKFALVEKNGKKELVIFDKNNKEITLDRSLLWEVGFNNPDGALFPENKDSEIIIEDHNMDNRLIYDEIIVNDTKEKWDEYKKAFEKNPENEGKKFGNEEYFFLNQIKDIRFGVNPNYIDGRFVPLGEDFKITGQEIIDKLGNKDSATITKKGIDFEITRDKAKGQIRIKVMNAFYAKAKEGSDHKFYSPAQKAYQEKINGVLEKVKKLDENSTEEFVNGIVESLHVKGRDCYNTITKMLQKEFKEVKGNKEKFRTFKTKLIAEIKNLKLGYLGSKKDDDNYKYDDMRFNAIRIGLKSGLRIGGPTDPVNTKKLGITSVIIPEVDIPYTDEFGYALTNKDKYVQEEIGKIKAEKKWSDDDFKKAMQNEDTFREVMEEAYRRVNKMDENTFQTLVTVDDKAKYGRGKYTVIAGKDLSFDDLANGGKALTDSKGQPLNPYYVVDKDGKAIKKDDGSNTTIADKIKDPELKKTDAYKDFISRPIDIAGYYMSKLGYNGAMYANFANYKLVGGKDQAPGIFGKEDDWHKKICYPGLGSCIENAGGGSESDKTDGGNKYGSEGEAGSEFELTYEPTPKTPDEEHPKVDKESKTDKVDVSKEPDKKVDFTIDVTVDKLKKDQKELSNAVKENSEKIDDANYDKETGYYIYRDGLIIDILPDIFEVTKDTDISIEVDKDAMRANGANAKLDFDKFQQGIKYFYKEDVKAYLAELKGKDEKKYNVLLKALGGDESKIKDGQRAILAWLPEFEGPHGAKNQFKLTLSNLLVNKEKYKESEEYKNQGQPYTNKGGFGDEGEFFFGTKTITVTDGHNANVNKYLQLLDKDGNVIPQGEAGEWFKGSATLKFGDKFNYKLKYYLDNKGLVDTGFVQKDKEWKLKDLFDSKDKNGLRPVLRDFVQVPDGFTVTYKVGKNSYTEQELKAAIEKGDVSLAKVDGILINPPQAGFPYNEEKEFILPMMIPELDARIENGKVVYTGTDGKDVVLGDAKDFFNLDSLKDKDAKMYFENSVKDSNTVTVYLEKERFIKLFKEFFEADGKTEIKKDRPEVKFDIWQIVKDEKGNVVERIKLDKGLTLNEANDFVDQVNHLPLFKRIEEMDEKGNVTVKILSYTYEVEEQAIAGYTGKVFKFDEKDALGFVLKAENYKKPERPPHNPPEEPETPPETPPEEPETPPETPPERPEKPDYPQDNPPHSPNKPWGPNNLPKTGLVEDLGLVYLSGLALVGLVLLRRKYFLD